MRAGTDDDRQLQLFTILHIKKQSVHYRILRSYKDTLHGPSGGSRTHGLMDPNHARYQLRYTRMLNLRANYHKSELYSPYLNTFRTALQEAVRILCGMECGTICAGFNAIATAIFIPHFRVRVNLYFGERFLIRQSIILKL